VGMEFITGITGAIAWCYWWWLFSACSYREWTQVCNISDWLL